MKGDGSNFDEAFSSSQENMTLLMEIYKILPKDINIVLAFDIFKKINNRDKPKDKKYNNRQLRNMFIVAMQNLKYMGYVGATRQ